eukprot:2512847-Amphidinium_carterae.1
MSGFAETKRWEPAWNNVEFFEVLPVLLAAWKQEKSHTDTMRPAHKRVSRPSRNNGQRKKALREE